MKAKSLSKSNKSKNFTFRITEALANEIASAKAKCEQCALRFNMTEALTQALVKELKAVEKELREYDPEWSLGQLPSFVLEDTADPNVKIKKYIE